MPTVHLSLPERTYRELKAKAAEMGIQVTDLIKLYIRHGLENGFSLGGATGKSGDVSEEVRILDKRLEGLEKRVKRDFTILQGRIREAMESYEYLYERIEQLEDLIQALMKEVRSLRMRPQEVRG